MSFHIQFKTIQDDADILMSETRDTCPDSYVDSLTGYPSDAVPPDGEAEPEGCGLEQQSTDDHTYNQAPLSYELQQGLRILKELMSDSNKSVNWHFLKPVDDSHPETADYYEKIKKPLWLGRMKEKFDNREYETITQFVADFRQMLENCYRFNGPDHFVSRRAQKLETMMEQKLNLLSRDLREKTSIAATSGQQQDDSLPVIPGMRRRSKAIVPHDSTVLLNQLRVEELQKEREARKQQMIERKAVLDAHIQGMMEWEDHLMEGQREHVKAMWEFPSIGLFLFLCHYPLNIGEVSQFELERCLFMPRESTTLQRVMTSLLSTPFQRQRLEKTGMMPYRVWNEKLRDRMEPWFKLLRDSHDPYKSADKFGIDPFLFKVVGKRNPMKKRKFHELSLYKKVWILKSLCDNCIESQESLVKTIDSQYPEEQKEYRLGEDAEGNTYLHFPQFCGADVRIYRQAFIPEPEMDGQQMEDVEEEEQPKSTSKRKPEKKERNRDRSKSKEKTTVPKKKPKTVKTSEIPAVPTSRPSRLRQTIKTVLPTSVIDESSTDDEFETTEEDASQSESESRCDSEEPENDSGMDNNTPFKNILRNRITDRDNLSETSSIDSDILWGMHRTRSGRIRFNGAMRMDNDIALANENSCDFDSTMSETSNPCPSGSKKTQQVNNASFCSVKTDKTFSENEMNSDSCQKDIDERGDCSSTFTENSISDMESRNKGGLDDKNHRPTDNLHNNNSSSHQSDLQVNPELQGSTEFIDEDSSTSNDFSEIDSQFSNLDENMSKSSSQHKSDIVTISRIFNKNMREKIYGNDSDTNSSFNEDILKTSDIILKQNGSSHVYENSVKQQTVINSKDDNLTSAEFFQVKSPDLDRTDILVKRGEVTPSNEIGSDTDTEFDDEKIDIDCLGTSHVKTEKSDYVSSKPVVEDQKKELNVSGNSEILDIKIEPKNENEIKAEVSENNEDSTSHLNMIKIEPDEKTAECLEKSFTDNFKKENEMDMLKDTECVTTEEMSVVKEEVMEESDEEEEETDLVEEEWALLKAVVKAQHYKRDSTKELREMIVKFYKEQFPNLIKLAQFALLHPIHTADCERTFSFQNRITTPIRNRLNLETTNKMMQIMINGPKLADFDFEGALQLWRKEKTRLVFRPSCQK